MKKVLVVFAFLTFPIWGIFWLIVLFLYAAWEGGFAHHFAEE